MTVTEDPYYCGLSARVPKFDKRNSNIISAAIIAQPAPPQNMSKKSSRNQLNVAVPKRMSIAYLQHPMPYVTATGYQQYASQQQLMVPRNNYQQLMWHARSMESGLGIFIITL